MSVENVIPLTACSPELMEQFAFMGEGFSLQALARHLEGRSMFLGARSTINSFTNDVNTRHAIRELNNTAYYSARCVPDSEPDGEIARYELLMKDDGDKLVHVNISPNAIQALYRPTSHILSEAVGEPVMSSRVRDTAAEIAYRGIYSGVVAQYLTKVRMLGRQGEDEASIRPQMEAAIDHFYEKVFGEDGITDPAARLERLASCLGGAVIFRNLSDAIAEKINDIDTVPAEIGHLLKMYRIGLKQIRVHDHKEVSFALAHAFAPPDAAKFMNAWFAPRS